jgi:hypothetical protein
VTPPLPTASASSNTAHIQGDFLTLPDGGALWLRCSGSSRWEWHTLSPTSLSAKHALSVSFCALSNRNVRGCYIPRSARSECTLFECNDKGPHCTQGQYRCPITNHCVTGAAGLLACPHLAGTHWDHTLSLDARLDYLVSTVALGEAIGQLTNAAPPVERLGIPGYNWLSDDEHGVRGWQSTYFPDGPGLGASFDKELLYDVGVVVGTEVYGNQCARLFCLPPG